MIEVEFWLTWHFLHVRTDVAGGPAHTAGPASSSTSLFVAPKHSCSLLDSLKSLRDLHDLCDVTLCVAELEVPAHRVVLAGCSPYFNAMFTNEHRESRQARVHLSGIDAAALESLVGYMYTASVEIAEGSVQNLLAGANLLGVESVLEACCEFLKLRLSPDNCLGIATFADMHGCSVLHEFSWRYVLEHFSEVAQTEELLCCPAPLLAKLIESDSLAVKAEEEVLACVLRWLQHDESGRCGSLAALLRNVRLPLIPWDHLSRTLLPLCLRFDSADCQLLITNARTMQTNPDPSGWPADETGTCIPRKSVGQNMFVYAVGGEASPGRATVNTLERFDPGKNIWQAGAAMTTRRRGIGVGVLHGLLYAVGGSDGMSALRLAECYDPTLDAWHRVADLMEPRSSVAAAILDGFLYAVGGYDGITSCLSSVERYDPGADTWAYVSAMAVPRSMVSVGVLAGRLLAVGGYDGMADLSSCESFDPERGSWEAVADMHMRRCMAGVAALGARLFAVGGCDCSQSLSSVEVSGRGWWAWPPGRLSPVLYVPQAFDPETGSWALVADLREPRSGVGVAVVDRRLYAVGGYSGAGSEYCRSVECYDPETNVWELVAEMNVGRRRFGCCS